jgi:hypothetical protein
MQVVVVGGGTAGVAAAVGAAEAGAQVTVLERYGFCGGMATAAQVGTLCGLFLREPTHSRRWAVAGFPRELAERLAERCGSEPIGWREGLWFLPYAPFQLHLLCDALLRERGVQVQLHSHLLSVERAPTTGFHLRTLWWDRPIELRADAVIDTTGTASASAIAGAALLADPSHQAPAIVFGLSGVGEVERLGLRLSLLRAVRQAVAADRLPASALALSLVPGSHRADHVLLKLGLPGPLDDSPAAVTRSEQLGRVLLDQVVQVLRATEPVFAGARLVDVSAQIGVRTGRRMAGRALLTDDDVLHARPHPEGVALGAWPVEHWGAEHEPAMSYPPPGAACEIPAGCLESADTPGLFAAGRCLSAERHAIAAVRVIGTCLSTGYAAGALAAAHALGQDRARTIASLRAQLIPDLSDGGAA